MQFHRTHQLVLQVFQVAKITVHQIIHHSAPFLDFEVHHHIRLVVVPIVLRGYFNLEPPLHRPHLANIAQLLSKNSFSEFLQVALDFLC